MALLTILLKIFIFQMVLQGGELLAGATKSLFDDLPLNGALPSDPTGTPAVESEEPLFPDKLLPRKRSSDSSSLFDLLPNQGALDTPTQNATGGPTVGSESVQRPSRHSIAAGFSPPARVDYGDFDVEHKPSTELDLSFFQNNLLPPLVQTLTQSAPSSQYGPAPLATTIPLISGGYGGGGAQPVNREEKYATRNPGNKGGATVIVYSPESRQPSTEYGPAPPPAKSETPKNEVHYHYHITKNTEERTTPRPDGGYGGSQSLFKSPPSNTYLPPSDPAGGYDRRDISSSSGYDNNNRQGSRRPGASPTTEFPILNPAGIPGDDFPLAEEFRSRTLNKFSDNFRAPSYGPPPSTSYGPPAPSYGPPPQVNNPGQVPSDQPLQSLTQTSITLETIPVTTTETRLVTVPKITQTLGSSQPVQQAQFDEEGGSGGYGSGTSSSSSSPSNTKSPQSNNPRTVLNEQLQQLSPRGISSDISDVDLLALLSNADELSQQRNPSDFRPNPLLTLAGSTGLRNRGSILNSPLLASSSSSGGYPGGLPGGSTVLTGDTVGAISDLIREQRLQQAVGDLRTRLRFQNRDVDRTRQNYRNLLYKSALLLGGLSLIPAVASVGSPLAAAGSSIPSSGLFPLSGRKKRAIVRDPESPLLKHTDCVYLPEVKIPFKSSRESMQGYVVMRRRRCPRRANSVMPESLFQSLPFGGAMVPEGDQDRLQKLLPREYSAQNSRCFQKYACKLLLAAQEHEDSLSPVVVFLSVLASEPGKRNRWLEETATAAQNRRCGAFYCHGPALTTRKKNLEQ